MTLNLGRCWSVPANPNSRRYQSPEKRGYGRIYVGTGRKEELDAAARAAGYATTDEYLWHLHQQAQKTTPDHEADAKKAGA